MLPSVLVSCDLSCRPQPLSNFTRSILYSFGRGLSVARPSVFTEALTLQGSPFTGSGTSWEQ